MPLCTRANLMRVIPTRRLVSKFLRTHGGALPWSRVDSDEADLALTEELPFHVFEERLRSWCDEFDVVCPQTRELARELRRDGHSVRAVTVLVDGGEGNTYGRLYRCRFLDKPADVDAY